MKIKKIRNILLLGSFQIFFFAFTLFGQEGKDAEPMIKVSSVIVDEENQPIEGVKIFGSKHSYAETEKDGTFSIEVSPNSMILLEKAGYKTESFSESKVGSEIVMPKQEFLLSDADNVNVGFKVIKKRNIVGSISSISPADFIEYDHSKSVRDVLNDRIVGASGISIRGLNDAMIVVDGIPGRSIDILNIEEVEQIIVLKDANAVALYGVQGKNGVILVTTKRGKAHKNKISVNINQGLKDPISLPEYLGSANYMELYNEARVNDGLQPAYTAEQINNYRTGNPYIYPNIDLYSDEYLKSRANYTNITTEFTGGNENTQYYVNLGWNKTGSLIKLNPDDNSGRDRFNIRGNIDFKVNSFIKSSIDVVSIIDQDKSSHGNFWEYGTTYKPHLYAPLLPVSLIDTVGNPTLAGQLGAANIYDGYLLGTTQAYKDEENPVAQMLAGGYSKSIRRTTQFNNAIDFDLSMIAEGLSAKTYLSFDFYNGYSLSNTNDYALYEPTWENDKIVGLKRFGDDKKDLTENSETWAFASRYGFYGLLNYEKQINKDHYINASLLGYANKLQIKDVVQDEKSAHVGLQFSYKYKDKLLADFSSAYVNSAKLPSGKRGGFSPTLGVAYILSEEDFIKDASWIDYLKVRASVGFLKTDINDYYLYDEIYKRDGNFRWADSFSNDVYVTNRGRNNNISFGERKDINIGFEALIANNLWIESNMFITDFNEQVTQLETKYPSYYNSFIPYENFASNRYNGFDFGLRYKQEIGSVKATFGAQLMYADSEIKKIDETYSDDYQYRVNTPVDGIWGLEADGFYSTNDYISSGFLKDGVAVPAYGNVHAGDIKYIDQNNDGVVNDQDQVMIGRSLNPWKYSLNLRLEYKGLSLFVVGSGQQGGQRVLGNNYYWVDGSDKYSEEVLGRWTNDNSANDATFPRLSSQKNSNNFRTSTFWMYDNDFFSIKRAQLTYKFARNFCKKMNLKGLSVYVSGANLVEFSKNKEKRQLRIDSEPLSRFYTAGLRIML